MKVKQLGLWALSGAILLASCNNADFKKTKGGMAYKLFPGNGKDTSKVGSVIKVNFKQSLNDSVLFSTFETMPVFVPVSGQSQPYDISELLVGLRKGDSVYATQAVDSFIKSNPAGVPPFFKAGSKLNTYIKVMEVYNSQAEATADEEKVKAEFALREDAAIQAYLKKNNITAQKQPKGTYVQVLDPGTGAQVEPGKVVSVFYKGTTFEGTQFDTNMDSTKGPVQPMQFAVSRGQMIPGFDEGVLALKEGGKARLYVPSMQAYGGQARSKEIKPYTNLIFDITVVKVQNEGEKLVDPTQSMPQNIDTAQRRK
jgi:FKBP-type peptidyl-prolyl cis-trans isomerase FkpA